MNIIYQSPELHEVYIDGKLVKESFSPVDLTNANGAHYWLNTERRFTLVIKGNSKPVIKTIDAVQVDTYYQWIENPFCPASEIVIHFVCSHFLRAGIKVMNAIGR